MIQSRNQARKNECREYLRSNKPWTSKHERLHAPFCTAYIMARRSTMRPLMYSSNMWGNLSKKSRASDPWRKIFFHILICLQIMFPLNGKILTHAWKMLRRSACFHASRRNIASPIRLFRAELNHAFASARVRLRLYLYVPGVMCRRDHIAR